MATLTQIRTAIATTLTNNITGVNFYRQVKSSIVAPALVVFPAPMDYFHTFGNASTPWEFDLIAAATGDDEAAQDTIDELIDSVGDRSIARVLLANPKLGRSDCTIRKPLTMSNYGAKVTFGNNTYVGATIRVGVVTTHA